MAGLGALSGPPPKRNSPGPLFVETGNFAESPHTLPQSRGEAAACSDTFNFTPFRHLLTSFKAVFDSLDRSNRSERRVWRTEFAWQIWRSVARTIPMLAGRCFAREEYSAAKFEA